MRAPDFLAVVDAEDGRIIHETPKPNVGGVVANSADTASPLPVSSWTCSASTISASRSPAAERKTAPASRRRSRDTTGA